jgi:8-oxo-dGTP pyrophosphatase MutT (NUDIX family)
MGAPLVQRRVAACAVVFDDRGRVLLHQRTDNGQWSLPGGAIEPDETAAAACVREVQEETGLTVEVRRLVGVYSDPSHTTMRYPDGNVAVYVAILFECGVTGGRIQLNEESSAVDWFDPRNLPQPFNANHIPRIADALAKVTAAFFR